MKIVNREHKHIYRVWHNYTGIRATVILGSLFECSYQKATSPKSMDCRVKLVLVVGVWQKTLLGGGGVQAWFLPSPADKVQKEKRVSSWTAMQTYKERAEEAYISICRSQTTPFYRSIQKWTHPNLL